MKELILIFCLIADHRSCLEMHPHPEGLSSFECFKQGQLEAVGWLDEHPKWFLAKWRCEDQNKPPQRGA